MKRDWTEKIKDKLSESAATPPDDLWAGISSKLDAAMPPLPAYSKSKQWRWWTVAACLAATVIYLMYNVQFTIHNAGDEHCYAGVDDAVINARESSDEEPIDVEPPVATSKASNHLVYTTQSTYKNGPQTNDGELPEPNAHEDYKDCEPPTTTAQSTTGDEDETKEMDSTTPDTLEKERQEVTTQVASGGDQNKGLINGLGAGSSPSLAGNSPSMSIGLYASNTNMPNLDKGIFNSGGDYACADDTWGGGNAGSSTDAPQPSYTLKDAKHRQPLRFGLSVRFPVRSSLSLGSGLVYSRLSSTITWESNKAGSFEANQTLNYIGIPVSVEYSLPSYRSTGFYITAGAMVEKCVYGESKVAHSPVAERVAEKALQLSVFAGAGVQLNLSRHISIYAEPLATYYIDNHSDVVNIYKDRKLNIDLRVGLRYTLK